MLSTMPNMPSGNPSPMRQYKGTSSSWYSTQDHYYEIFRYHPLPHDGLRVDYYNISCPARQCFRVITDPSELVTIRRSIGYLAALYHPVYSRNGRTIVYFENPFVVQPPPPHKNRSSLEHQKQKPKTQRRSSYRYRHQSRSPKK